MPNDARVYTAGLTLIVFLVLRIPGIWQGIGFGAGGDSSGSGKATAGAAIVLGGLVTATSPVWATPTHIFDGRNWAHFIDFPLIASGCLLMAGGIALIASGRLKKPATARLSRGQQEGAVAAAAK